MAKARKIATAPTPDQIGVHDYVVTEKAPEKIAGILVQPGDPLTLTDEQAAFDELAGHIRKVPVKAASTGV